MDWISVKDRLPKDDATYLVYGRNGYGIVFAVYYGDREWLTDDLTNITRFVTHWMPLPSPPEGGTHMTPKRLSAQILIDCDGNTTTATMTINGREIKTAIARRNPADKFDWKKGAELAFDRLWDSQKKPEVREVKRFAKPGEYIKIVYVWDGYEDCYHKGDIFLVTRSHQGTRDGWVNVKGTSIAMYPKEYVVLEGYRP